MHLEFQMTLALPQELLIALRANVVNNYEPSQILGIENPESDIVVESEPE